MGRTSFFGDLLQALTEKSRHLLRTTSAPAPLDTPLPLSLKAEMEALIASRSEASGMARAQSIIARWHDLDDEGRLEFLEILKRDFGPDTEKLDAAIKAYLVDRSNTSLAALNAAAEPRRQELLRRLNLAAGGTATLVKMRETLLKALPADPDLQSVDADFLHLFTSWFNRGFLLLRPIDWSTPANILEKIIQYEAVHDIGGWDELRRRLAPPDRRCFAFFHPQLADEPLIFVEVALTGETPTRIADVLHEDRPALRPEDATTAVFYSISNCQFGLRGVSFGSFLIKQVVDDLRRDFPQLQTFVTLSPVPGFAKWLRNERKTPSVLPQNVLDALSGLDEPRWHERAKADDALTAALLLATSAYFLRAEDRGRLPDPVGRFHLGNGARLERLNALADISERGLKDAHGMMVNYLYKLDEIDINHETFSGRGEVVASEAVSRWLPAERTALIQDNEKPLSAAAV